jgi:hypothetical protein
MAGSCSDSAVELLEGVTKLRVNGLPTLVGGQGSPREPGPDARLVLGVTSRQRKCDHVRNRQTRMSAPMMSTWRGESGRAMRASN